MKTAAQVVLGVFLGFALALALIGLIVWGAS